MRYEIFSNETMFSTCVYCVGCSRDAAETRHGPTRRDYTIIHYCTEGAGTFNGHTVRAGEGFIIRPGDFEHYYADAAHPWAFLWLVISTPDPEQILSYYHEDVDTHIFSYDFVDAVRNLEREISTHSVGRDRGLKNWTILMRLLDQHRLHERRAASLAADYAAYARDYIDYHAFSRMTIEEVARRIGVSTSYLYRVFTAEYGLSPRQFLNECRLRRARDMLLQGESVSETAHASGYDDVLEFSRFFKAQTGLSPRAFVRECGSEHIQRQTEGGR